MAYISQDEKKSIEVEAKKLCKEYGVKATFAVRSASKLVVTIREIPAKWKLFEQVNSYWKRRMAVDQFAYRKEIDDGHWNYHPSYIETMGIVGDVKTFFEKLWRIVNKNNYDRSRMGEDYFDVGYYVTLQVGEWNKPVKEL